MLSYWRVKTKATHAIGYSSGITSWVILAPSVNEAARIAEESSDDTATEVVWLADKDNFR